MQHYTVTLATDESGQRVTALTWEKTRVPGTMAAHLEGVFALQRDDLG